MKIISHRGNLSGPNLITENTETQIDLCISLGYDVEIDLRCIDNKYFLGHDNPDHQTSLNFLLERKDSLWIHCKNYEALILMMQTPLNYFWHEYDKFTITSKKYIWTYPCDLIYSNNKQILLDFNFNLIHDLQKYDKYKNSGIYGLCLDYII